MTYRILFYETESGNCPVDDFLKELSVAANRPSSESIKEKETDNEKLINKINAAISTLEEKGPLLGPPKAKKLTGSKDIHELCIKFNRKEYRILWFIQNNEIIFLHGFQKKTQKTRSNHINCAEKRKSDWERRFPK